nr:P1 family peptidase [Micromonospora provocatoris]
MPQMSVASVDQRGGAPATKETDLLSPLNSNPGVNAIQLGGSSMYGLSATNGIIRWLEDRGEGVRVGAGGVAPIVPAADIFDLGRGGDPKARTSAEWGYLAAQATSDGRSARAASAAAPAPVAAACAAASAPRASTSATASTSARW